MAMVEENKLVELHRETKSEVALGPMLAPGYVPRNFFFSLSPCGWPSSRSGEIQRASWDPILFRINSRHLRQDPDKISQSNFRTTRVQYDNPHRPVGAVLR